MEKEQKTTGLQHSWNSRLYCTRSFSTSWVNSLSLTWLCIWREGGMFKFYNLISEKVLNSNLKSHFVTKLLLWEVSLNVLMRCLFREYRSWEPFTLKNSHLTIKKDVELWLVSKFPKNFAEFSSIVYTCNQAGEIKKTSKTWKNWHFFWAIFWCFLKFFSILTAWLQLPTLHPNSKNCGENFQISQLWICLNKKPNIWYRIWNLKFTGKILSEKALCEEDSTSTE